MTHFTLHKFTRTRYLVGKKQVPAGTPGARKVTEKSPYWYAYLRTGGKQKRVRLFTDKKASESKLAKMNIALERGEAGMTDPRKHHLERAATAHLEEFLPVMRAKGKSEKDKDRKEAILRAFVATLKLLSDLTYESVDRYLLGVQGSSGNKKKHLSAISVFVSWLLKKDRIGADPLTRVDVPGPGKAAKERRALTVEQIQKLLDAARARPLAEFHKRHGTAVKETVRQKERAQEARDATTAKMVRRGRERALVYKMAVYTGLRLGEIASLRPCHLELHTKPFPRVEIPGKLTKNDQTARLLLVPSFALELAAWIEETKLGPDDLLFHVPQASARIMQADLTESRMGNAIVEDVRVE